MEKGMVGVFIHTPMGEFTTDNGGMDTAMGKESNYIRMAQFTMETGLTIIGMALACKHAHLEINTRVNSGIANFMDGANIFRPKGQSVEVNGNTENHASAKDQYIFMILRF